MNKMSSKDVKVGDTVAAVWDFAAREEDELNLEEDDQAHVVEVGEDGWLRVEYLGKVGWIPGNYVSIVQKSDTEATAEKSGQGTTRNEPDVVKEQDENEEEEEQDFADDNLKGISVSQNRAWFKRYYKRTGVGYTYLSPSGMKVMVTNPHEDRPSDMRSMINQQAEESRIKKERQRGLSVNKTMHNEREPDFTEAMKPTLQAGSNGSIVIKEDLDTPATEPATPPLQQNDRGNSVKELNINKEAQVKVPEKVHEKDNRPNIVPLPMVMMPINPVKMTWKEFVGDTVDLSKLTKMEIKRQESIFELTETEKDYVADLDLVREVFIKPLKKSDWLSAKDISILFSNIEQLLPVNQELLKVMVERRADNAIVSNVGDIFLRMSDYLKIYTMYCSNHPYAVLKLQNISSRPFNNFLKTCRALPECNNMELHSFLIKPVQRICKYPLLIREMIRNTEENHPDRADLEKALIKIQTVVTIINEAARQTENVNKILELQAKLSTKMTIVTPSRVLVKEGILDVWKKGKRRPRRLFIFNDLFIMTKDALLNEKYHMRAMVPFDLIQVGDVRDDDTAETEGPDGTNMFEIMHVGSTKYTFVAESTEEKDKWVNVLQDLVSKHLDGQRICKDVDADGSGDQLDSSSTEKDIRGNKKSKTHNNKKDKRIGVSSALPINHVERTGDTFDLSEMREKIKDKRNTVNLMTRENADRSLNFFKQSPQQIHRGIHERSNSGGSSGNSSVIRKKSNTLHQMSSQHVQKPLGSNLCKSEDTLSNKSGSLGKISDIFSNSKPVHASNSIIEANQTEKKGGEEKEDDGKKRLELLRQKVTGSSRERLDEIANGKIDEDDETSQRRLQFLRHKVTGSSRERLDELAKEEEVTSWRNSGAQSPRQNSPRSNRQSSPKSNRQKSPGPNRKVLPSVHLDPAMTVSERHSSQNVGSKASRQDGDTVTSTTTPGTTGINETRRKSRISYKDKSLPKPTPSCPPSTMLELKGQTNENTSQRSKKLPRPEQSNITNQVKKAKVMPKATPIPTRDESFASVAISENGTRYRSEDQDTLENESSILMASEQYGDRRGDDKDSSKKIKAPAKGVCILDVFRQAGSKREYIYVVEVTTIRNEIRIIFLTYEDFFEFHLQLLFHFPEEAGTTSSVNALSSSAFNADIFVKRNLSKSISSLQSETKGTEDPTHERVLPDLPIQMMFVSGKVAKERMETLQTYLQRLIALPPKISRSYLMKHFLNSDGKKVKALMSRSKAMAKRNLADRPVHVPQRRSQAFH